MKYILSTIIVFTLYSCATYKGITLSVATINGKKANQKIINRYPDYGDGHADGCLVMAEMRADLSINKSKTVLSGKITDVINDQRMRNADVTIMMKDSTQAKIKTDENGEFNYQANTPI